MLVGTPLTVICTVAVRETLPDTIVVVCSAEDGTST